MHDMGVCSLQYRGLRQSLQEQVNVSMWTLVPTTIFVQTAMGKFQTRWMYFKPPYVWALYVNEASSGYLLRYLSGMRLTTFWSKETCFLVRLIYPWGGHAAAIHQIK